MHAPHHVSKEWSDKYKGEFDKGWDKVREESTANMKAMGVIPENTILADKPEDIKDWDKLTMMKENYLHVKQKCFLVL